MSLQNVIEPFDPQRHDRAAFFCGVAPVDNFFRHTANKLAKADNLRVFAMVAPDGGLVGFYALNAHSIDYTDLAPKFARTRPGHGGIPAAFISMIGVRQDLQGQGHGGDLLVDALKRIARAAEEMGIAVALLDVLDCGDADAVARRRRTYAGFGFEPLPSNPLRMVLPMATVRKLLNEDG